MSPKRAKRANELPFIPLGPFQWRIPGIHYGIELKAVAPRIRP